MIFFTMLFNGPDTPQNCPSPCDDLDLYLNKVPSAHPSPKQHADQFSRFFAQLTEEAVTVLNV